MTQQEKDLAVAVDSVADAITQTIMCLGAGLLIGGMEARKSIESKLNEARDHIQLILEEVDK